MVSALDSIPHCHVCLKFHFAMGKRTQNLQKKPSIVIEGFFVMTFKIFWLFQRLLRNIRLIGVDHDLFFFFKNNQSKSCVGIAPSKHSEFPGSPIASTLLRLVPKRNSNGFLIYETISTLRFIKLVRSAPVSMFCESNARS